MHLSKSFLVIVILMLSWNDAKANRYTTSSDDASCNNGATGNTPVNDEYVLVWSDEFDLDGVVCEDNWHFQTQCLPGQLFCWANNELQHYTDRTENAFIDDGVLKIVAKREGFNDQGQDLDYTSARLNSKFAFTYGRVDVRAKLPSELGTWPAIWMLGKNISEAGAFWAEDFGTTAWPATGEIDIMEQFGRSTPEKTEVHGTTHTTEGHGGNANGGKTTAPTSTTDFHVYSIIWDENEIQFLYDDVEYYTYNPVTIYGSKNADNWPFDEPQFILLNIAMGGVLGGNVPEDFVEATMEIDYVRVYQNYDENPADNLPIPQASAPIPEIESEDVIAIFSDAYTVIEDVDINFESAEITTVNEVDIDGDNVIKVSSLNYQTTDFSSNSQNLTEMDLLHIDYWTANAAELRVSLIDANAEYSDYGITVVSEEWVSLEIPLTEFSEPLDISQIAQLRFEGCGTLFLDNIYFSGETIELETQTITFPLIDDQPFELGSFTLQATASSGLDIEFSTFSTEISIDGALVTFLRPGTVVVSAGQPGNESFLSAESITQIFCVNPAKPTITTISEADIILLKSSSDLGNQWFLNGEFINDQKDSSIEVDKDGTYTLKVLIDGCTSPISDELPLVVTGIESTDQRVKIVPNPATDFLRIYGLNSDDQIQIVDMMGKIQEVRFLPDTDYKKIDLEHLPSGVFIALVHNRNNTYQFRFVKTR